jgi:hypothetical protein
MVVVVVGGGGGGGGERIHKCRRDDNWDTLF